MAVGAPDDAAERLGNLIRATAGEARRIRRLAEQVLQELRANGAACAAPDRVAVTSAASASISDPAEGEAETESDWRLIDKKSKRRLDMEWMLQLVTERVRPMAA